jgi:serine/threonine protein phosphatase PrpC
MFSWVRHASSAITSRCCARARAHADLLQDVTRPRASCAGACACDRALCSSTLTRVRAQFGHSDLVTVDPHVIVLPLTADDEFILLGCDGLFDYNPRCAGFEGVYLSHVLT